MFVFLLRWESQTCLPAEVRVSYLSSCWGEGLIPVFLMGWGSISYLSAGVEGLMFDFLLKWESHTCLPAEVRDTCLPARVMVLLLSSLLGCGSSSSSCWGKGVIPVFPLRWGCHTCLPAEVRVSYLSSCWGEGFKPVFLLRWGSHTCLPEGDEGLMFVFLLRWQSHTCLSALVEGLMFIFLLSTESHTCLPDRVRVYFLSFCWGWGSVRLLAEMRISYLSSCASETLIPVFLLGWWSK